MMTRKNRDEIMVDIRRALGPVLVWRMKESVKGDDKERLAALSIAASAAFHAIEAWLDVEVDP